MQNTASMTRFSGLLAGAQTAFVGLVVVVMVVVVGNVDALALLG